ncbi:ADP-ribosylation factor-like protein 6-interacting protein 4 [Hypanus sabinus]|uniref:ADP-ribosylation factor-like protein 6-interacting protein 4 n=1 Tax=Hypanus sabinus TaxID=79690 RepID=UPI0028C4B5DB|nr:ADP-ribosylation factor-like protein 6-interacting protein 4 [Hypanus sabinus]
MDGDSEGTGQGVGGQRPVARDRRKRSRSSSSSSSSSERRKHKKRSHASKRKKEAKQKKKKSKKRKKKLRKVKREREPGAVGEQAVGPPQELSEQPGDTGTVVTDEQKARIQAMRPMTKEEWETRQSVVRHVVDLETGRKRLIKGDGEVLEEIVSFERHKEINKQATRGDGFTFQVRMGLKR